MNSSMSGERRWASARRGGMTVLGEVAVPKPLNLPSQRLENHGLDPNVEIVPKGNLSWGNRSSSSVSNPWSSSTMSPNADGGISSPSHLSGRPSSGGTGSRPSTAGTDRTHEPTDSAWSLNSRPPPASGACDFGLLAEEANDLVNKDILDQAGLDLQPGMAFDSEALKKAALAKAKGARDSRAEDGVTRRRPHKGGRTTASGPGQSSNTNEEAPLHVLERRPRDRASPPSEFETEVENPTLTDCRKRLQDSLHPDLVKKYQFEIGLERGVEHLMSAALQMLSITRGVANQSIERGETANQLVHSVQYEAARATKAEEELKKVKVELEAMTKENEASRDENARLLEELKQAGDKETQARALAVQEFKGSEEYQLALGNYALESYTQAIKQARAWCLRVSPDLNTSPMVDFPLGADDLDMTPFEEECQGEEDDGEGVSDEES